MGLHACSLMSSAALGVGAVRTCVEDMRGRLWVSDGYLVDGGPVMACGTWRAPVNYCPFCGKKAALGMGRVEDIEECQ